MSSQIFKDVIPGELLFGLLEYIYAFKTEKYYIINNSSFKKAQFKDILNDFIKMIEPYYHTSKLFYITREMTYTHFLTIIRQICNCCSIKYTSKIKYISSNYDIHYYIYFDGLGETNHQ
jgi:hypothetical protein